MSKENIIEQIVNQRKSDIEKRGYNFGFTIPEKRTRPINPFMEKKGVILEVKRASPSKGDIAPGLNAVETALKYRENGAGAISCLTEENYFKGSLQDLMDICNAIQDVAVLRKDFLIDEQEVEIAFRCGADAVLLISGMLTLEKMISMAGKCAELGIRALVEVRTPSDVEKALVLKEKFQDTIVCGVNSRNLKDFSIDLLVPAMLKKQLGGKVIFESGITTAQAASKIASMDFAGILLGEFAARNPKAAGEFVQAFEKTDANLCGNALVNLAETIKTKPRGQTPINRINGDRPLIKICGLTRPDDVLMADSLGADFVGFIFATEFDRNVYGPKFNEIKKILPQIKAKKVAVITRAESVEAHDAADLVNQGILDFIQIHGIEYENVPEYLQNVPHYFALTSKTEISKAQTDKMFAYGESRFLQDCREHKYGTTDHLWLAGGVTPDNVSQLIKMFTPELVDISSGLETRGTDPGIKDHTKMKKFFEEFN